MKKSTESLITETRSSRNDIMINRTIKNRKEIWEEKQLYGYFERQTDKISDGMTWTWLRKGNLKREIESLLIVAYNSAIRTNYVKAKKKRCNRIISVNYVRIETKRLITKSANVVTYHKNSTREYTTGWGSTENHARNWSLRLLLNGIFTNRICAGEWDTQNSLWFWNTNISPNSNQKTRLSDKKRTCKIVVFAIPANDRLKMKENEKRDKYLATDRKKTREHVGDGDTNCNWCAWNSQKVGKEDWKSWKSE